MDTISVAIGMRNLKSFPAIPVYGFFQYYQTGYLRQFADTLLALHKRPNLSAVRRLGNF